LLLRAYLVRLAQTLLTPAERAERAEKARVAVFNIRGQRPAWRGVRVGHVAPLAMVVEVLTIAT
jgi:hypothetical protein